MNNYNTFIYQANIIEETYGKGNFDDFGDEFIFRLNEASEYSWQFMPEFDFDSKHHNPFFHNLTITVPGITLEVAQKVRENIKIKESEQNDRE